MCQLEAAHLLPTVMAPVGKSDSNLPNVVGFYPGSPVFSTCKSDRHFDVYMTLKRNKTNKGKQQHMLSRTINA